MTPAERHSAAQADGTKATLRWHAQHNTDAGQRRLAQLALEDIDTMETRPDDRAALGRMADAYADMQDRSWTPWGWKEWAGVGFLACIVTALLFFAGLGVACAIGWRG